MKQLFIPLVLFVIFCSACKKNIEQVTVTNHDTVRTKVDSSKFTRAGYTGKILTRHFDGRGLLDSSSSIITIVATTNYVNSTISFVGSPYFFSVFPLNSVAQYPSYSMTGDSLYASAYVGQGGSGYSYSFNGKK